MLGAIKDYLRTSPRLFDTLRALKRATVRQPDPAYEFFRDWSRGRQINFVQIGANDGLRNDPFREFILKGWRGILVEPLPDVFELLKRNYAHCKGLKFVNAAISQGGNMTFYSLSDALLQTLPLEKRLDYQRKASFSRAHVEHYVAPEHRWGIKETPVQCLTFESLLGQHWTAEPIHLLALDVEGHEPDIIRSINFDTFRPEAIFYESHALKGNVRPELEAYLCSKGYAVKNILGDTVAQRVSDR